MGKEKKPKKEPLTTILARKGLAGTKELKRFLGATILDLAESRIPVRTASQYINASATILRAAELEVVAGKMGGELQSVDLIGDEEEQQALPDKAK